MFKNLLGAMMLFVSWLSPNLVYALTVEEAQERMGVEIVVEESNPGALYEIGIAKSDCRDIVQNSVQEKEWKWESFGGTNKIRVFADHLEVSGSDILVEGADGQFWNHNYSCKYVLATGRTKISALTLSGRK